MNIKRAKEEIKNCIEAYLLKDGHGEYVLPAVRQRPVLLMGPPGIGKTQIMEQIARECQRCILYDYPPYEAERHRSSLYCGERIRKTAVFRDGIYHERDRCSHL